MFFVSDIYTTAPETFKTPLHEKTYEVLEQLQIPFERVLTDEAITMDDCESTNKRLNMKMVKTLFLCNRQKNKFYVFITTGEKSFNSKNFSNALQISRVSFAPVNLMQKLLGTKIGAATIFSAIIAQNNIIEFVFDKDVTFEEWYGCSDGTTTGYMKIRTTDIINKFMPFTHHTIKVIKV